ncbi:MAG: RNB domain-containing ribonuclease, partial [Alphaproteobacteria bacterium]|nr:RNB domain-containing ribonuclease [Alphaproteobacteria bacterium]
MSEHKNMTPSNPSKRKTVTPKKSWSKKGLNEELKESGLTKSEFFKTKFSKKRSHKKSPSDSVSNRGTYGETTAQKKAKELEDAATAFLNRASYEEARSSYKNKSHKESSDKKTYRKETPSRDYSKDRGARPLDIGMFIHARIIEILTDTGNSYLSAMGDHKGKQIFMEHVPDTIDMGNTVVVKLTAHRKKLWYGQMIRILPDTNMLIGVFNASEKTILPIHRKRDFVPVPCDVPLQDQMVVVFEEKDGIVHIREQIGLITSPKSYSKVAAFSQGVWKTVTPEEEAFCQHFKVPGLKDSKGHMRDDLRDLDLVTIDGADAKDFDDAVWAAPDEDPRNEGGYRIVVAIADVSYYVREGDVLDQKAQNRGNSVYFPDYVLPMLPEGLSNDLCSLKPNVDRACLVADMIITKNGRLKHAHFKRALMRSKARLTYDEVEKALMGKVNKNVEPVFHSTILPLASAYALLREARDERGSLNIHSFEHQILFDKEGHVKDVTVRPELKSNQLIEEMMVLANIAVAKALKNRDYPCMYRIHPAPDGTKVQNLKIFTKALNLPSPKSDNPTPHDFNRVLSAVEG